MVTLHAHGLTRELVWYLTKKHTVFRDIIKATEKLVIIRWTIIRSLMLRTIFYTIWCALCYYTVIFKAYRIKYNWIFTKKSYYFPKIAHVLVYHRTHLIKEQIINYGNIFLGVHFNLRYSKLKSNYSKVIKSAYVMGVVQNQNFIMHHPMNSGHLNENNDVKHNIFRCLIPLI